jgi:Uma2 family endonuclease
MPATVLPPAGVQLPPLRAGLPTDLDLPDTDGLPVQNTLHPIQTQLLTGCLLPVLKQLHPDGQFFIGEDTGLYYMLTRRELDGCKSPDWFYVPNVPPTLEGRLRRSYVLWQELQAPFVVIEYASGNGAEERDRTRGTGKMLVYEQGIHIPYYFIFHPERNVRIEGYRLVAGRYQELQADSSGRLPVPEMRIRFGLWSGRYRDHQDTWMRAWSEDGSMLPTPDERADAEKARADALAVKLRALGIDPDAP